MKSVRRICLFEFDSASQLHDMFRQFLLHSTESAVGFRNISPFYLLGNLLHEDLFSEPTPSIYPSTSRAALHLLDYSLPIRKMATTVTNIPVGYSNRWYGTRKWLPRDSFAGSSAISLSPSNSQAAP